MDTLVSTDWLARSLGERDMGAAAIEPDVEDVRHLLIIVGLVGIAEIFLGTLLFPGVDAFGLDRRDDPLVDLMSPVSP